MTHRVVVFDAGAIGTDIVWPDFSSVGTFESFDSSTPAEALERIKNATIVLTNKVKITCEMIAASPNLVYIGTLSTGYNQVDLAAASKRGIPICNVPNYSTSAVAQHTFALILSLAGDICEHASAVAQGAWVKSLHFCFWNKPVFELEGKTLGIVGFGHIGKAVAKLGHCFGMNILSYTTNPKSNYKNVTFTTLDEVFANSDIVSLHCPLTDENKGMINAQRLATMKKNALLINCSRGGLVNENDLATALKNKVIAGAGLDVVAIEPMLLDNPLRTAPNCLITPHMAWASVEARTMLLNRVLENIQAFIKGNPRNVINR